MLIGGFRGNTSERIARELKTSDNYVIGSSAKGIEEFIYFIDKIQPDRILVFGAYSGRDKDKLRVETICNNKFRNTIGGSILQTYSIPYFIQLSENIKLAKGIGNS